MPADNGQPEAKTDIAPNVDFHAILGLETAVFSHFLEASRIVIDPLSDSAPAAPARSHHFASLLIFSNNHNLVCKD